MNYILGDGSAAILLKLLDYKNEYRFIGNNLGGQFNVNFQPGPRILKSTKEVDKFLKKN